MKSDRKPRYVEQVKAGSSGYVPEHPLGVRGLAVDERIGSDLMLSGSQVASFSTSHFSILTHRGRPDPEIRNFKLSCLNGWFLARTCLSKPVSVPLLGASVSREVLGGPERYIWTYPHGIFPAGPSHGCAPKEAGDRGGWGLREDLPPHRLQQGPVPRGLRPYCL